MPSAKSSMFVTGSNTRDLPPASAGLRAPAGMLGRTDKRRRAAHPAANGRMSDAKRQEVVATAIALMDAETPAEIAVLTGTSADGRTVREIIREARTELQRRARFYLDLHAGAAAVAASNGDAKPAQWALERIAEGGDRVVDEPSAAPPAAPPQFNLGFVIGGIPMPSRQLTAADLPVLDASAQPVEGP